MLPVTTRRPTNLSLRPDLVAEARDLGINVSRACETGLIAEIREAKAARWLRQNSAAIEATNEWVEANGLPLARHRLF